VDVASSCSPARLLQSLVFPLVLLRRGLSPFSSPPGLSFQFGDWVNIRTSNSRVGGPRMEVLGDQ
jgi:hypothetical protein